MNHSGWIMKWGAGYSSAPLEHLHCNKTLPKTSILSSDEANKPCVKQKAVSNPLLKTIQPTANTAAQQEYMNSCKVGKFLSVTQQVWSVCPFIKQGYFCGARRHMMESSVQWGSLISYSFISCAYSHTYQALQLKCWIRTALPSPQGPRGTVASLNPIQTSSTELPLHGKDSV